MWRADGLKAQDYYPLFKPASSRAILGKTTAYGCTPWTVGGSLLLTRHLLVRARDGFLRKFMVRLVFPCGILRCSAIHIDCLAMYG